MTSIYFILVVNSILQNKKLTSFASAKISNLMYFYIDKIKIFDMNFFVEENL